jgi:hypothetical protein
MDARRSLAAFAFTVSSALALAAPVRADYKDERLGMSIQTPKGWTTLPVNVDERWKAAKYLSDKTYFWTEKGGGWTYEHKPSMEVIAFVAEAVKEKVKVDKKQDKNGNVEWRIYAENPYKDYKDFLTRRYQNGGWFVSKEEETKLGDVAVTCYEIKVEKLSSDGPKHIFTWVYHVSDVDIAVQFEVLETSIDKLKSEVTRCLRSFKSIPRTGGALYEPATAGTAELWSDQDKLTPDERKARRQGMEQKSHEKAAKNVPDGWVAKKIGRFMVLNHADEKFAKAVVEQAEAVWSWLDATFPFVGKDEYVRAPILRICKDWQEQSAFMRGGDWFSRNDLEITTCQDYEGKQSWEMEWVNRRVKDVWFRDRDWDLSAAMPGWLQNGLDHFVGNIHVKSGKPDFTTDYYNKDEVRERMREGKLTPLKELMMLPQKDMWSDFMKQRESASLVGFFVTGKASRDKRTKNLLSEYVKNLQALVRDIKKEDEAKGGETAKKPETEAEEDALFKNRAQGYKAKEQRLLGESFKRTFVGWDAGDWKSFEEAFQKSL